MRRAAIRLNAGPEIGYGHLRRGMILAGALQRRGVQVIFVCPEKSPAAERLQRDGFMVQEFPSRSMDGSGSEIEERVADHDEIQTILSLACELVILDIQDTRHTYAASLKEAGMRVVNFDDLGDGRYVADLVVDANLSPKTNPKKMETPTRYLLGPRYAVLPSGIRRFSDRFRSVRRRFKKVVVSCGGTDPAGATVAAVAGLANLDPQIEVDVILGGGFSSRHRFDEALTASPRQFKIHQDVPDLIPFLREADLGVVSGGITLFEAAAVGLPCLVISQNKHQLMNTRPFEEAGGVISLGLASNVVPEEMHHAVLETADPLRRAKMRRVLMELVDGRGLGRVVREIERLVQ